MDFSYGIKKLFNRDIYIIFLFQICEICEKRKLRQRRIKTSEGHFSLANNMYVHIVYYNFDNFLMDIIFCINWYNCYVK